MKVLTVIGARPQYVKCAVVSRALAKCEGVEEYIANTGQHYDDNLSSIFVREMFSMAPDVDLEIGSGPHGHQTARMLTAVERLIVQEDPAVVLVYGDTNSTLAGMLAATKLNIPVAHIEAGLRSYNRRMPEEINRVLTDHGSDILFAPTVAAVSNLRREGLEGERVIQSGDVMYDATLYYSDVAENQSRALEELGLEPQKFILATCHRAENTGDPDRLKAIVEALTLIAAELPVVLPLHPRTYKAMKRMGLLPLDGTSRLRLVDPLGYLDMLVLEKYAAVIATDSGGVQKEAFFHRVPCVTFRDETEWVELVEHGWNQLAPPTAPEPIVAAVHFALSQQKGVEVAPYGTGNAASVIARSLIERYDGTDAPPSSYFPEESQR